jgi:hypothetical protein
MSLAIIKDNHITVFGTKYFTGNAQLVSIGSIGEKATPVFGQNKLEPKDHIPAPKFDGKIRVAGPITLDSSRSKKNDFTAMVSGTLKAVGFTGSVGSMYDALVENRLKLVQLFVEEEDMKDAANRSPQALDHLKDYGGDARIAHQLFVLMEATWASSFTGGTRWNVGVNAGSLSITAGGGTTVSGKDTITLTPGMGLAYLLLNPDWNKGKTQIEKTHVDEWSVN